MDSYFFASRRNPFLHFGQQTRGEVDLLSQRYPQPGQVRVDGDSSGMLIMGIWDALHVKSS
jgi:hypothetical protein